MKTILVSGLNFHFLVNSNIQIPLRAIYMGVKLLGYLPIFYGYNSTCVLIGC